MRNFMDTFIGDRESYIQAKIAKRVEYLRHQVELRLEEKETLARELAPALDQYKATHELFTVWKLGKAVYGKKYCPYDPWNGNSCSLSAKMGAFLVDLTRAGYLERIEGLNNPHCPHMYRFIG